VTTARTNVATLHHGNGAISNGAQFHVILPCLVSILRYEYSYFPVAMGKCAGN
jgi:hypothetical protein